MAKYDEYEAPIVTSVNSIKTILNNFNNVKAYRSRRDEVVSRFYEKLKSERGDKNFYFKDGKKIILRPITLKSVAMQLRYIKEVDDLNYLYSICKDATSFSKLFWYMTKTTKVVA